MVLQANNKKKGKALWLFIGICVMLIIVVLVAGILIMRKKIPDMNFEQLVQQGGMNFDTVQSDMLGAYGVTSIGTLEATFPIGNLENQLEIAEIYVASGEEITEGKALFRLTESSIEAVRTELEEEYQEAELAYLAGAIEYEQSKITAFYEKENTLLTMKQAEEVYEETIANLYDNVEKAKEELDSVKADIATYEAAIAGNTYYEDYQVEYYKNIYDENLKILQDKVSEWGVSWSEITGSGMSGGMGRTMDAGVAPGNTPGGDMDAGMHSQYVTVLSSLYQVLEQNLKDYEQALEGYEDACANAGFELQTLKLQVSELEESYAQAKENYDTNISQAKLTKETSISNGEKAESIYEADIEKAEADYLSLQSAKEEAETNLALFEKYIVEGCYVSDETGNLMRVNLRTGAGIGSDSRLYSLKNMEEISVTVSVAQADIAKIVVGENVSVQSESGTYEGTVTAINPVSASDSKTSVTYSVTVMVDKADNLSSNETVIVYFGMKDGEKKNED